MIHKLTVYIFVFYAATAFSKQDTTQINAYLEKAWEYRSSNVDSCIQYSNLAITSSRNLSDTLRLAKAYRYRSISHRMSGNFKLALDDLFAASYLHELQKNQDELASDYIGLGNVYYEQNETIKTEQYWEKAIEIFKAQGNLLQQSLYLGNLGLMKLTISEHEQALKHFNICLAIYSEMNDNKYLAKTHLNIGAIFRAIDTKYSLDSSFTHYNKALQLYINEQDVEGEGECYIGLGELEKTKGNFSKAEGYILKGLGIFDNSKNIIKLSQCYGDLYAIYKLQKNYKKALFYQEEFDEIQDTILNGRIRSEIAQLEIQFSSDKKERLLREQELILKHQKAEISTKNAIGVSFIIGFVFITFLIFVLIIRNREKNKTNAIITTQKEKLETINNNITDSIEYARNIQNAILPTEEFTNECLGDHFIVYKPKDIVSGDFYWVHHDSPFTYFALADCTGHGVPGAFMSMLGTALLNEVVVDLETESPDIILNQVKAKLTSIVKKKGESLHHYDGMNIGIIVSNEANNIIEFSGAFHPLYIVSNNKKHYVESLIKNNIKYTLFELDSFPNKSLIEIKGDLIPVGKSYREDNTLFTKHSIDVQNGDNIYLFSDGYVDQLGGPNNSKFMVNSFKEVLLSIYSLPMKEQQRILEQKIDSWLMQGAIGQIDDISVAGIRFDRN